jgi:hypothetical protein
MKPKAWECSLGGYPYRLAYFCTYYVLHMYIYLPSLHRYALILPPLEYCPENTLTVEAHCNKSQGQPKILPYISRIH